MQTPGWEIPWLQISHYTIIQNHKKSMKSKLTSASTQSQPASIKNQKDQSFFQTMDFTITNPSNKTEGTGIHTGPHKLTQEGYTNWYKPKPKHQHTNTIHIYTYFVWIYTQREGIKKLRRKRASERESNTSCQKNLPSGWGRTWRGVNSRRRSFCAFDFERKQSQRFFQLQETPKFRKP